MDDHGAAQVELALDRKVVPLEKVRHDLAKQHGLGEILGADLDGRLFLPECHAWKGERSPGRGAGDNETSS